MINEDAKTKELQAQLKFAQKMIKQLREENKVLKDDLEVQIPMFEESVMEVMRMVKWSLPLHRQVKNLHRKNRTIQAENRALKEELQLVKSNISKRIVALLAKVANVSN